MTFREFMQENGYELQTTFWNDFSIADRFGLSAVQDTFNRAFEEWKKTTSISPSWYWCSITKFGSIMKKRSDYATLYNTLYIQADQYAAENLKDEELSYFYDVTD